MAAISIEKVLADEADALKDPKKETDKKDAAADERGAERAKLHQYAATQPSQSNRADKDANSRSAEEEAPDAVEKRKAFYRSLNKLNHAALCLSGGGIRSATFCLGVIQALAKQGTGQLPPKPTPQEVADQAEQSLLRRFHYLSTVSGGGYVGSWLSTWHARTDFPTVWRSLISRPEGPDVEPPEISWLRSYSNYLTPQVGLLSADTWTGAAIFLRNLLLNWLVIIPAIAVVLLGLKLTVTFFILIARMDGALWIHALLAMIGVASLIAAQAFTTRHRPTRRGISKAIARNIDQTVFVWCCLAFSLLSAICLTSFLTSQVGVALTKHLSTYWAVGAGAIVGVPIFAAGWLSGAPANREAKDFWFWALSGLVYGGLMGFGAHLYTQLNPYAGVESIWNILIPVVLGVPWVLASQLFAEMVFVGLVSYEPNSDSDREWLGRGAGWIAATAIVWGLTTFLVFAAGHFLLDVETWLGKYIASAGGVAGVIAALLGKSSLTSAKKSGEEKDLKEIVSRIGLGISGPVFAAILVVGISVGLDLWLLGDSLIQGLTERKWSNGYIFGWLLLGLAAAFAVALIASRNVNINRFSLHALYRNRLVRAYLGASRRVRTPDLFTGFDNKDNLPAHDLWRKDMGSRCLFHVVNIALNVVKSKRLAWQERKAESFTVSALYSGAAYKGYRPSKEYGGGISIGTALAISGAAASPNMGYHSNTSTTLLLALFNVRLGWWLGNPGPDGERTYKDEGPATAIVPLVQETFGLTTDDKPYVYLSDGGHFENLGLYEMVRRRCRFIIVVDAGCDPKFEFEDLGNAVRKIFIDLGIRIEFDDLRTSAQSAVGQIRIVLRSQARPRAVDPLLHARRDRLQIRGRRRLRERLHPLRQASLPWNRGCRHQELCCFPSDLSARVDWRPVLHGIAV